MASHIKYLSISILLFVFLLSSMRVVVHAEEHSVEYEGATYTYSDAGILISAENAIGAVDLAALAKDNNITLKVIGKNAFTYGNNITSVNIPASVMIIDEYAFSDCGNLTKLTYEGQSQLTTIGLGAFSLDYAFSEFYQTDAEDGGKFNFPEGLTTISGYAFQSTTPKEVIIPEKCGQIGDNAFESDSAFSVIIYNNNIVIGDGAFPGTTIIYANPDSSAAQYAGDNGNTCNPITDESKQSDGESGESGEQANAGDSTGETSAPEKERDDKGNDKNNQSSGEQTSKEAEIDKTVNVENVQNDNGKKLTEVNIEVGKEHTVGNLVYKVKSDYTLTLLKVKKKSITTLKVPAKVTINGSAYPVTGVSKKACYKLSMLKTVSIGNNVTVIGNQAFMGCKKLKTVTMGKKVTEIGSKCFCNDKSLKKIVINSRKLKKVGKNCMKGTPSKRYMIPKGCAKKYRKLFV